MKNFKAAAESFALSIKVDPNIETSWFNLGQSYFNLKDIPSAIKYIEKSLSIDYQDGAYDMYGWVYFEDNKYDSAIVKFKNAVEMDREIWDPILGISVSYYMKNDKENARKYLVLAQENEPRLKQGMKGIALLEGNIFNWTDKVKKVFVKFFDEMK